MENRRDLKPARDLEGRQAALLEITLEALEVELKLGEAFGAHEDRTHRVGSTSCRAEIAHELDRSVLRRPTLKGYMLGDTGELDREIIVQTVLSIPFTPV